MAWFKKDEPDLPESLKGKTPEEIAAAVERSSQLEQENASLRTENQATTAKFESFGQTLQEMNSKIEGLTKPAPRTDGGDGGGGGEPANFLTDPDRAFAERAAPIVGLLLSTSATLAKQQARESAAMRQRTQKNNIDGTLFDKFDEEIMTLAKTCSPNQLATPATWTHLFYNVKGRHADEIVTANIEKKGEFFVEAAQRPASQEVQESDTLTPQQLRIAEKMGVKPENYLKNKKEMVVGVPETI